MAKLAGFDIDGFNAWAATRPAVIQDLCKRLPPDRLYLLKTSGHRVTLYSYSEDGTVTVNVTGKYNMLSFDRRVFGIDPDNLEECDFPSSDEPIGTVLTEQSDIDALIDSQIEQLHRDGHRHNPDRCVLCAESKPITNLTVTNADN